MDGMDDVVAERAGRAAHGERGVKTAPLTLQNASAYARRSDPAQPKGRAPADVAHAPRGRGGEGHAALGAAHAADHRGRRAPRLRRGGSSRSAPSPRISAASPQSSRPWHASTNKLAWSGERMQALPPTSSQRFLDDVDRRSACTSRRSTPTGRSPRATPSRRASRSSIPTPRWTSTARSRGTSGRPRSPSPSASRTRRPDRQGDRLSHRRRALARAGDPRRRRRAARQGPHEATP